MLAADKAIDVSNDQRIERLQQQVQQLQQQLMHVQRLAALGELVSTTTHEFNNVLTTVLNYAKLGMRHRDEASRDRAFEKILSAGQRAAQITNSILGVARNRGMQLEPTDLSRIVYDVMTLLEREMHKYRIRVELQIERVPMVRAQASQMQQLLLNLVINARQAMGEGGQLTVRLRHDAECDWVELTVRDTGPGIPEDQLPRIFEPFYSTKTGPDASGKGGTGLGLAACRQIVQAHQGTLRVASTLGRGTAFTVRLPVWTQGDGQGVHRSEAKTTAA